MAFTAADVKRLREETDAPMMECKSALTEADGDFDKAKVILREKGMAQAGKKAGRATGAGVVAFAPNADATVVGAVVVATETDFVSGNQGFIDGAQKIADFVRDNGVDEAKLTELAAELVALFRENVVVAHAHQLTSANPIATYVHFDRTKGTAILSSGEHAGGESARKVAVHATAFPPQVVRKDQLSQEVLDEQIKVETQRAVNEGKDAKIAENVARGRVNKEYVKQVVLLEQPFYADGGKTVQQWIDENAKGLVIEDFKYLAIGQ